MRYEVEDTGQWVNDNRVFRVAQLDGEHETWLEAASEADAIAKAEREFREADARREVG